MDTGVHLLSTFFTRIPFYREHVGADNEALFQLKAILDCYCSIRTDTKQMSGNAGFSTLDGAF